MARRAYIASNALFRQVRHVNAFLVKQGLDTKKKNELMRRYYPWIESQNLYNRDEEGGDFVSLSPTDAALKMVSQLLGISASKVEKLVHRSAKVPPK